MWLQLFTYSVGIFLIFVIKSPDTFGIKKLFESALPITFSGWWFASVYFVLYLVSPYINKLLNSLDKKEYFRFLTLLLFCWCIIPTIFGTSLSWQSNSLLWFVFIYSLAGYVKLHIDINKINSKYCFIIAFIVTALTFLSTFVIDIIGIRVSSLASYANFFYDMQKLPILIISLMLFIGFINIDIGYMPVINVVSSATFGVYLIHDNIHMKHFLWNTVFKMISYENSNVLILYSVFVVIAVFICCSLIELFRIYCIEKFYIKAINSLSAKIDKCLDKLFASKLFKKF